MATGRLGAVKPSLDTDTVLYTAPAAKFATLVLSACNQTGAGKQVRIAVSASGASAPAAADFIEYDAALRANTVLERSGVVVSDGQKVFVRSGGGVSFVAYGFEGDV